MFNKNTETVREKAEKLFKSPIISKLTLPEKYKKRIAFTLAEVLITLLIIGVVASLVIPALINDTNKAEYVTKLKKEFAVLQQAFKLLALDAGGTILNNPNFNCSGSNTFCNATASANAMNDFATKLNVVKNCGSSKGCWYASPLKYLGSGVSSTNLETSWNGKSGKAILADGTLIRVRIYEGNCTTTRGTSPAESPLVASICGSIGIDVNGSSKPNQLGRDFFYFWITKTGIYPLGTYNDGYICNINSSSTTTSQGCAGKVLSEGAMNY